MLGHEFLKKMGRSKLSPAGGYGSRYLTDGLALNEETQILEVACNYGANLIHLYNAYGSKLTGIDKDVNVIEEATRNLSILGFDDAISLQVMDATALDFPDNHFDIVLNEAMLTMLETNSREKAVKEYYRVLKPGGLLLTHDVWVKSEQKGLLHSIGRAVNMKVHPMTVEHWLELFRTNGYTTLRYEHGPMKLLDKQTIIDDEGPRGAVHFYENVSKLPNQLIYNKMADIFNKGDGSMGYIVLVNQK